MQLQVQLGAFGASHGLAALGRGTYKGVYANAIALATSPAPRGSRLLELLSWSWLAWCESRDLLSPQMPDTYCREK